jgi:small basic protein
VVSVPLLSIVILIVLLVGLLVGLEVEVFVHLLPEMVSGRLVVKVLENLDSVIISHRRFLVRNEDFLSLDVVLHRVSLLILFSHMRILVIRFSF